MARVSDNVLPSLSQLGLYLDRYQEIMGLDVCAFNGINRPTDSHNSSCIDIVSQSQRDDLAKFLLQAEEMREEELGYFLAPKYRTEDQNTGMSNPFILDRKYLIEVGWPTCTLLEEDVPIVHGDASDPTDPITIDITTDVATSQIVVTYPDESVQIHPTHIVAAGGVVTITIPRCRLVRPEYNQDWDDPPSYYDEDVFLEEVDIYRCYSDVSLGAQFMWDQVGCDTDCEPNCQPACPMIVGYMAYELSLVKLFPATYSSGAWTRSSCFAYSAKPNAARITYLSGRHPSMSNEIYTIRLAHTLMPRPPCSCDIVRQQWTDDRVRAEGQYSPYGSSMGAIDVWLADSRAKVGHGGMF